MRRVIPLVLLALATGSIPAAAQSHFGVYGLGAPLSPLDARARALGGIGVGLFGLNTALVNPAEVAGLRGRAVAAAIQPTGRSVEFAGRSDRLGGTRFPLIRIIQPMGQRLNLTFGYGGFLDQSLSLVTRGTAVLNGDTLAVRDEIRMRGGISQFRAGAAFAARDRLAFGLEMGFFTGERERLLGRSFDAGDGEYQDFGSLALWRFRGPFAVAGVRWDPAALFRLAGSVLWAGDLSASGIEGNAEDSSFSMPLQVHAGASGLLAPRLRANIAGSWAGWGVTDASLHQWEDARDSWAVGAGLEWDAVRTDVHTVPVRFGINRQQLPFVADGATASEWSVGMGGGLRLTVEEIWPRASFDGALEVGSRSQSGDTGLSETFWRLTLSLALFGT